MHERDGGGYAPRTVTLPAPNPALSPTPPPADEEVLFEGRPAVVASLGHLLLALLTVGLGWVYLWLRSLSLHYKVTTQRVVIDRGLFSKRLDQIDLYRVQDYVAERPLGQRMLGTGNLVLQSGDKSTPEVRLDHLKTDVVQLYERVRQATEHEKRRRGVRVVDTE